MFIFFFSSLRESVLQSFWAENETSTQNNEPFSAHDKKHFEVKRLEKYITP